MQTELRSSHSSLFHFHHLASVYIRWQVWNLTHSPVWRVWKLSYFHPCIIFSGFDIRKYSYSQNWRVTLTSYSPNRFCTRQLGHRHKEIRFPETGGPTENPLAKKHFLNQKHLIRSVPLPKIVITSDIRATKKSPRADFVYITNIFRI